ncbi:putative amino-acid metabolite efflux pump [Priestia megaterium Q3]|uniref:Putative amino-acid metabolite efflux pump n=1 Tax=Priestia megaterium Q3 TaxID=1452722 RepID=A0A806TS91_PRIMG|nr:MULTISPECIES: DMT family transporter [Priestia]AKP78589.1 putative amino-acid metabolite efflux pump [Priestia megaterium Q3]MDT0144903.1 DMT family transporter [Priestia aryabhattai]MDT0151941.1 DMT family transporter [Priestia aryabhattai]
MKQSSSFINGILLAALVLIWGLTWPVSKLALGYSSPILLSGVRSLLAGIVLLAVALPRYKRLHWKQNWHKYMVSGLFNAILFYGLQTLGLMFMPAGVFSVIVYLQPVLIGIIAWLWIGESMNAVKVGGLLLGFVGVATISMGELSANASAVGIILAVLTALSWAIGTVYIKRISDSVDGIWLITIQSLVGGVVMTATGSGVEGWSHMVWNSSSVLLLLFLALFSVAVAWLIYFHLISHGDASKVASFNFLVPIISIVIGTLFLDEPFTSSLLVGLALIIISIYLVNKKAKNKKARPSAGGDQAA